MRFAYEFYHPYFRWLQWHPGDRTFADRETAVAFAALCPYKTRIIEIEGSTE